MDSSESTKILYSRIQKLEPQLVSKIVGYLLLRDNAQQEMTRLAEDLPKYLEYTDDQTEHGFVPIGVPQIYLTFPAECVFTEQDVLYYFSGFGPVQDVRIPCQQKQMFSFVTFLLPEKGNPHFICGARVLLNPTGKSPGLLRGKNAERKQAGHLSLQFDDGNPAIASNLAKRAFNGHRLVRKQLMEEQEHRMELERRLSEIELASKSLHGSHGNHYSEAGLRINDGYGEQTEFMSPERFSFLLDVLTDESTSSSSTYNDHESNRVTDLPLSSFANSIANNISTITW